MRQPHKKHRNHRPRRPAGENSTHDHIKSAAEPATNVQPARTLSGRSRKIARRYTWGAFKALSAVMDDPVAAATARVNAANTILEWGHGKRGETATAPTVVEKIIKIDWGGEQC